MDAKIFKHKLLEALYAPYKNCTSCPLGFMGRINVVFGDGNPNATLMFIGEGPGRDEDIQGKPFVGRSGQLLNKVLEIAEINRADVYITNIVKCRPPNNRQPTSLEAGTCKNLLLMHQVKIIRPKVICTLGSSALQEFIDPSLRISQVRGKIVTRNDLSIIPTYHPAYILRNPKELEKSAQDIQLASRIAYQNITGG